MRDVHYGLDTQTDCQLLANYLSMCKSRLNEISFFSMGFSDCDFIKLPKKENSNILLNYFTISINENLRNKLMDYLKINGISTSIYYKTPVHQLPALSFMKKSFLQWFLWPFEHFQKI